MTISPLAELKQTFGYDEFRPLQLDVITSVLEGQDSLVIMPTGGGKSICYQLPALLLEGVTIVISPLIALMQDQVRTAQQLGIAAYLLNSSQTQQEQDETLQAVHAEQAKLLYLAPERLQHRATYELLRSIKIAFVAIDEAHCVSQWGHDFRPDYLNLNCFKQDFELPIMALTATANDRTRQEIVERLCLQDEQQFIQGFDRPNIYYQISPKDNPRKQLKAFLQNREDQCGIIYCLSRKKTEQTATWLQGEGFSAAPYHAGLTNDVRAQHQEEFLNSERKIIVATIAFGMGIDKPDVRFVVHLDIPKSIESYYQETGRAGRDGEPADAYLLYGLQDVVMLKQMTRQNDQRQNQIEQHKLDTMLAFCETTDCRRKTLLQYFGESASPCNHCDTCITPPDTFDGTESAQKALSAIHKTGQRFGATHVIDVLVGKESDRMFSFDHHHLSVFGIGKQHSQDEWRGIIRQLVVLGYVNVDVEGFNGLKLTEACRPLLRGEATLLLKTQPKKKAVRTKPKQSLSDDFDFDELLYEYLREWRTATAKAKKLPPYTILHDATLKMIAANQPADLGSLGDISGIGAAKLDQYGDAILSLVSEYRARS